MLKSTHASAQNFIFHLLFVVNPRSQFLFLFTFCSESSSNPTAKVILEDRQGLSGKFIIPVVYALLLAIGTGSTVVPCYIYILYTYLLIF